MKLPVIGGREAVPVRLIPFATQGFYEIGTVAIVSMLAGVLAPSSFEMEYCNDEEQAFCKSLVAYCRDPSGTYHAIKPVAWDRILCDVKDTRKAFGDLPDRKERLKQSIAAIPAGFFLWRTDFEKLWQIRLAARSKCKDERPGEREIDYGPMLDSGFSAVVWEGFEGAVVPVPAESPAAQVASAGDGVEQAVGHEKPEKNKGGRPPEYLMEALDYVYRDCRERGDTSILEPHQLQAFLKHLQKLSGCSRNMELVSKYISERIVNVQPSDLIECVKIHERAVEGKPYKKSEWYSQADISTRMNTLRKKYRLPTKENIQEPVVSESENRGL